MFANQYRPLGQHGKTVSECCSALLGVNMWAFTILAVVLYGISLLFFHSMWFHIRRYEAVKAGLIRLEPSEGPGPRLHAALDALAGTFFTLLSLVFMEFFLLGLHLAGGSPVQLALAGCLIAAVASYALLSRLKSTKPDPTVPSPETVRRDRQRVDDCQAAGAHLCKELFGADPDRVEYMKGAPFVWVTVKGVPLRYLICTKSGEEKFIYYSYRARDYVDIRSQADLRRALESEAVAPTPKEQPLRARPPAS